jgi:hypothetical protein
MLELAEQILETGDIRITKGELWAKYQGAINYDQMFHRDFGNHTLVVPREDHRWKELTTFIYLSDVTKGNGATALIPRQHTDHIPLGSRYLEDENEFEDHVIFIEAPAGSLVLYSYDVFHRGVQIDTPGGYRFMMLADYARRDAPGLIGTLGHIMEGAKRCKNLSRALTLNSETYSISRLRVTPTGMHKH